MFDVASYFRWQDILDILVVAFVIYQLISIIRGTRSVQMVLGLGILFVVYFVAKIFELSTLMWMMQTFLSSILLIVIIVFQQDIRRALTQVGKSPFQKATDVADKDLDEIIRSVFYLSKRRIGALIVIERETGLQDYVESGFDLDARLTKELLISIFMPVSPLHDGGVIVHKGRIQSAGCILPLTQNPYINKKYGTRHRAAIGISEETDAVVLVVSEETQEVSVVRHGALTTVSDEISLSNSLRAIFIPKEGASHSWKSWF
ncbi:diadenylate cyclase CdaA [Desulfopila aestuarii]|uniref:Diadenylate cyclase n=1 Tax=Desulfopila aestuarii DSM 18488 TaxID=1121416 RepID=A0A1M7Y1W7_9BACT|nr:diadenylate cyclase CdaA [Desulfopila aestuarii]SHO45789.1 diadenylate cyclase [Desulfopila aestuarii DSM 18488]